MTIPVQPLRIVHAIHDYLPRHCAGSEIYVSELCRELARRHHVTVLCADYDPSRPHGQITWRVHDGIPVAEVVNNWVGTTFTDTYRPALLTRRLAELLDVVQPHVLHIHNLLNLSFDLPAEARRRGIATVATLHDYTLVCPSGGQRLHRSAGHVCHDIDVRRCAVCFPESPFGARVSVRPIANAAARSALIQGAVDVARRRLPAIARRVATLAQAVSSPAFPPQDFADRLTEARRVFEDVDLWVAPSASLAEEFRRLGMPADRLEVADYGFASLPSRPRTTAERLRIGFVGTLVWHKGVHVLLEAARHLPDGTFELRIHGAQTTFPEYLATLRALGGGLPVSFEGAFTPEQAGDVYSGIDVLVVPSLWLENSPLVIHEAFLAGIPVVGANIGGISDLISDGVNGLLYEPSSPHELARCLTRLITDRDQLGALAHRHPPVKGIDADAREWEARYRAVVSRYAPAPSA